MAVAGTEVGPTDGAADGGWDTGGVLAPAQPPLTVATIRAIAMRTATPRLA
jgi:hypothetical protein